MEKLVFLESFITLTAILAVLITLYFYLQKQKKKQNISEEKMKAKEVSTPSLESLMKILKTKTTSTKELEETINMVLNYYGDMNENFNLYINMILHICNHPNTNKNIIIHFEKALCELNPQFKNEVAKSVMEGLNARKA